MSISQLQRYNRKIAKSPARIIFNSLSVMTEEKDSFFAGAVYMSIIKITTDFDLQPVWFLICGGSGLNLVIKQGQKATTVLGWTFIQRNYNQHLT
jgi:UDP-N-acetylglucosamine pyrophosphorylase